MVHGSSAAVPLASGVSEAAMFDAALARPYQRRRSRTVRHLDSPPRVLSQLSSAEPPSSPPKVRLRGGILLVLAHVALQFLRELRARVVEEARAERGR